MNLFLFVVHEDAWTVLKLSSFDLFRMSWVGCVNNFKDVPYYPCRGKNYRHQRSFIAVKFMHKSDIIVSRKKVNSFRESHVCYQDPQFHDSTWLKCVTKIIFFFCNFTFIFMFSSSMLLSLPKLNIFLIFFCCCCCLLTGRKYDTASFSLRYGDSTIISHTPKKRRHNTQWVWKEKLTIVADIRTGHVCTTPFNC